jgi:hypothetical protein
MGIAGRRYKKENPDGASHPGRIRQGRRGKLVVVLCLDRSGGFASRALARVTLFGADYTEAANLMQYLTKQRLIT